MNFKEKINYLRSYVPDAVLEDEHGEWTSAQSWANVFGMNFDEAVAELSDAEAQGLVSVWDSEYDCIYIGRVTR